MIPGFAHKGTVEVLLLEREEEDLVDKDELLLLLLLLLPELELDDLEVEVDEILVFVLEIDKVEV
jgi:hypothetical protein